MSITNDSHLASPEAFIQQALKTKRPLDCLRGELKWARFRASRCQHPLKAAFDNFASRLAEAISELTEAAKPKSGKLEVRWFNADGTERLQ